MKLRMIALTAALLSLGLAACSAAPAASVTSGRGLSAEGDSASPDQFRARLDAIVEDARTYTQDHPLLGPDDLPDPRPDMDRAARTVDSQLTLDLAAVGLDHTVENNEDSMAVTVRIPDGSQRARSALDNGDPDGDWQGMEDAFTQLSSDIYAFFSEEELPDVTITVTGVDADSGETLLCAVNGSLTESAA